MLPSVKKHPDWAKKFLSIVACYLWRRLLLGQAFSQEAAEFEDTSKLARKESPMLGIYWARQI